MTTARLIASRLPLPNLEPPGVVSAYSVVAGLGLVLSAAADAGGRAQAAWAYPVFWLGIVVLVFPVALRLAGVKADRGERMALLVVLAVGMYIIKVLHSPSGLSFHDELVHWRTTSDIMTYGRLFHENAVIPASPFFPGLEIVTSSLAEIGGLSVLAAGLLVVGAARLALVLSLYLLYEEVSQSSRVASLAVLLYMGNPNFLFFDAQFAYESLALPLFLFALVLAVRLSQAPTIANKLALVLALSALVATHHASTYALALFFGLWHFGPQATSCLKRLITWYAGEDVCADGPPSAQMAREAMAEATRGELAGMALRLPGWVPLIIGLEAAAWLAFVAPVTTGYLRSTISAGVREVGWFLEGNQPVRQLFRSPAGQTAPAWEQIVGYSGTLLILAGLLLGLIAAWRRCRSNALAVALMATACVYPFTLVLRLFPHGVEIAQRSTEFLYLGLGFVLAMGIGGVTVAPRQWRTCGLCVAAGLTLLISSGIVVGRAPWMRLPGPYLVSADERSIESEGLAAAEWSRLYLGDNRRMAADRVNGLLMTAYGMQRLVTATKDGVSLAPVYMGPEIGQQEQHLLQDGRVEYAVVDQRLSQDLPYTGVYFDPGEPQAFRHTAPLLSAALNKFSTLPGANLCYDSGNLQIYDLRRISYAP